MPTTFKRCDSSVPELAIEILCEYPNYENILNAKVKIDFVFAYAQEDENGELIGDALTKNGIKALGICRKIPAKDRALGRGDVEIAIDGNWWGNADDAERKAHLDHELYHIALKAGVVQDDGRPTIGIRKHDVEIGWFRLIASRHGDFSIERKQAKSVMEMSGQFFWPELFAGKGEA